MRIIGKEDQVQQVPVNQEYPTVDEQGQSIIAMHDLTVGRYDVNVSAGPSFTTQRQEAAVQMGEMLRAVPDAAPVILPRMIKNLDWPGADDIAKDLEKLAPGNQGNPEQVAQAMQQAQEMSQQAQQGMQQVQQEMQAVEQGKAEIDKGKAELEKMMAKLETKQAQIATAEAKLQAEVAKASANLQGREMDLSVKSMQADQREATVTESEKMAPLTERLAGLEGVISALGSIVTQPKAEAPKSGRRQVRVKREKNGELVGLIEDLAEGL